MGLCGLGELLTPLLLHPEICNYTFLNALTLLSLPKQLKHMRQPVMTGKEVCEGPELKISLGVLCFKDTAHSLLSLSEQKIQDTVFLLNRNQVLESSERLKGRGLFLCVF